jgi:hypothetical protein
MMIEAELQREERQEARRLKRQLKLAKQNIELLIA